MITGRKRSMHTTGREIEKIIKENQGVWEDLEANYPPGPLLLSEAERKDDAELSYLASPLGLALQMVKKMFRRW